MLEPSNREWFGKHLCEIIQCMNFLHHNLSLCSNIPNKMILDTDIFGLEMINIILDQMNYTLTIREHNGSTLSNTKLNNRPRNQVSSLTPLIAATYSTLVVDKVAIDCTDAFPEVAPYID